MKIPDVENEISLNAKEMKYPLQTDNIDWGKRTKLKNRKVVDRDSKTGVIYGSKTIMTKEHALPSVTDTSEPRMTFIEHLLNEGDDVTMLPEKIVGEIKSNVRKGAQDLEQKWKNALELLHKAYQVANVRTPVPSQKSAWKQYEELIQYSVRQLSAARGLTGEWRSSGVLVREAMDGATPIGRRRFFVEIPGEASQEVDAESLDEVIEAITNKILRSREVRGTKVRIEERTKTHAVLTVWVEDVKRERIVVKEVS